jgi:hypothetical protein
MPPELTIQNNGRVKVVDFKIVYSLNGGDRHVSVFNADVNAGEAMTVALPEITMAEGANALKFEVIEPNALVDADTSDTTRFIQVY